MADKTGIEWANSTWNPTTGCDQISPGCNNCYALTQAKRLKAMSSPRYQNDGNPVTSGPGFALTMHDDNAFYQPLRWTKPRKIFVNSMSDLFHAHVTPEFVARVYAVMALTPHHTYQILTKRPRRMRTILTNPTFAEQVRAQLADLHERQPVKLSLGTVHAAMLLTHVDAAGVMTALPNVWLGTSVENQDAVPRIDELVDTPAAVRFLSCEPLLGPLDLTPYLWAEGNHVNATFDRDGNPNAQAGVSGAAMVTVPRNVIHWVIVGGESGPNARPMHPDWAESIRDQCVNAGVAFLFKQWGEWSPLQPLDDDGAVDNRYITFALANDGVLYGAVDLAYPDGARRGEAVRAGHGRAHLTCMYRVGKRLAGRELDNRLWDEYPTDPAQLPA